MANQPLSNSALAGMIDHTLLRNTVGPSLGVKASGRIRTRKSVEALIAEGANRLQASAGIRIVGEKT